METKTEVYKHCKEKVNGDGYSSCERREIERRVRELYKETKGIQGQGGKRHRGGKFSGKFCAKVGFSHHQPSGFIKGPGGIAQFVASSPYFGYKTLSIPKNSS